MEDHNRYQSPLTSRYASVEMSRIFSSQYKHSSWRQLWVALARAQGDLGLKISASQVSQLESCVDTIDFEKVREEERALRHDVMAHIHCYAEQCPEAAGIIHLGATSAYVVDNTALLQHRDGLDLVTSKLVQVLRQLRDFAYEHRSQACLSYTHFQTAQPTTVGKRACLWLQDFLWDLEDLERRRDNLQFLGVKGTTGTQASFLSLFDGDHSKVEQLDDQVAAAFGFRRVLPISGQTYSRKQDAQVLDALAGLATSAHKMATDLRLLAHLKELEEPFEKKQVGSSAMPYKRNPMMAERICSLSRLVVSLSDNPRYTAATQWLERSLDDSANSRISIAEAFLATDAILNLLVRVTDGLVVYPNMIERHLAEELPFLATETILMACVQKGGNRQKIHELLRQHSIRAAKEIKENGADNDLLERLSSDGGIPLNNSELKSLLDVGAFIGRAPEQVQVFLTRDVSPVLESRDAVTSPTSAIEV